MKHVQSADAFTNIWQDAVVYIRELYRVVSFDCVALPENKHQTC